MDEPFILIVGAADTGRAPMTAALLRHLLEQHGLRWRVESAGVVGHDEDPAESEARAALLTFGLDLSEHRARSLTPDLVGRARLIVAIDSGVARVVRLRHPDAAVTTLGELAGRSRDIPDPFRMQVGAWVQYAHEIEGLLRAGLPRLRAAVVGDALSDAAAPTPPETPPPPDSASPQPTAPPAAEPAHEAPPSTMPSSAAPRLAAVERIARLLTLSAEMPGVIDWSGARQQIETDLNLMETPLTDADLARPYVAILRAMLALCTETPVAQRLLHLRDAVTRLRNPVAASDLDWLSQELRAWTQPR